MFRMTCFALLLAALLPAVVRAQAAGPLPQAPAESPDALPVPIELSHIMELGRGARGLVDLRDNVYARDAEEANLHRYGNRLLGAKVEIRVRVRWVRQAEVFVDLPMTDNPTRLALRHAQPPYYGSLQSVHYGHKTQQDFQRYTPFVGLRIGSEIPFELARTLRRGDVLVVKGYIDEVELATSRLLFNPTFGVVIGHWVVAPVPSELYQ